ncbi:MAG: sulfatase-like hydrolase/transferase [Planctomycetota bacterium]
MRNALRFAVCLALALASLCRCGPGTGPEEASPSRPPATEPSVQRPHVLLITLDTTRQDRLGCYGYASAHTPNLDALAADGVRFENAYTCVPITLPSHTSMLTGNYPFIHNVRDNGLAALAGGNVTLAERLKLLGYETAAFVSALVMSRQFGLDQGFDVYDDELGAEFVPTGSIPDRPANRTTDAVLEWLSKRSMKPFFLWVHYFDPHLPYEAPAAVRGTTRDDYDAEIAFMDREIGRLVATLRQTGAWENCLVFAVGDHGEGLGDNGEDTHGFFVYESTVKVPFIVRGPGLPRATVVAGLARTIDIVPTVCDLVGAPLDPPVQGTALLPLIEGRGGEPEDAYLETFLPHFSYGWSWQQAVRVASPAFKYIDTPKAELYDLSRDPKEGSNLHGRDAERDRGAARRLAGLQENVLSGVVRSGAKPVSASFDLEALGYVQGKSDIGAERGPDVKDVYRYKQLRDRAMELSHQKRLAEALVLFREFAKHTPLIHRAKEYIGCTLAGLGHQLIEEGKLEEAAPYFAEAIAELEVAVEAPDRFDAQYHLAVSYYYRKKENPEEVARDQALYELHLKKALEIHPTFGPACYFLGLFYAERQRWQEAAAVLRPYVDSWRPGTDDRGDFAPRAATVLGNALFAQQELAGARACYLKAGTMSPVFPDHLYYLSQLERYQGQLAAARQRCLEFLGMAKSYPDKNTQALVPKVQKLLSEIEVMLSRTKPGETGDPHR